MTIPRLISNQLSKERERGMFFVCVGFRISKSVDSQISTKQSRFRNRESKRFQIPDSFQSPVEIGEIGENHSKTLETVLLSPLSVTD